MKIEKLLAEMWTDYVEMNPQAKKIYELFTSEGETILNDHIALRTYNLPEISIDVLAKPFIKAGYVEKGEYHFEDKKLYAKHWEHKDEKLPKIFISELLTEKFDPEFQKVIKGLVKQIKKADIEKDNFCYSGRPWEVDSKTYEFLKTKSDYASWVAAWGFRPNHFTVFINKMKKFNDIRKLNTFIQKNGFELNASGGVIKGTATNDLLEQSSTIANNVMLEFSDKKVIVPGCYYEFAQRYPDKSGKLYQGFVAKSADKIFESTDRGQ